MSGTIYIPARSQGSDCRFRVFHDPVDIVRADNVAAVLPAMQRIMKGVRQGLRAAGWLAYEAAPAMDSALETHPACPLPRLWFGLYRRAERVRLTALSAHAGAYTLGDWVPSISPTRYLDDIARIRRALAGGVSYQVNHTLRLRTAFHGDPAALFLALYRAQPSPCAMFIDAGDFALASASPELFVRRRGMRLSARPMKGTASRTGSAADDARRAEALRASGKDRAENVMIVDMIRNDMGRVAAPGSVRARRLFTVETYPTVFQMTSTVSADCDAPWPSIMQAMFPCASITGAPKVQTMRLIRALETTPRGVYTGCMGYIDRPSDFHFNVAIRTVTVDRQRQTAEYGVGGGIVWDSQGDMEYQECLAKAAVLQQLAGAGRSVVP